MAALAFPAAKLHKDNAITKSSVASDFPSNWSASAQSLSTSSTAKNTYTILLYFQKKKYILL